MRAIIELLQKGQDNRTNIPKPGTLTVRSHLKTLRNRPDTHAPRTPPANTKTHAPKSAAATRPAGGRARGKGRRRAGLEGRRRRRRGRDTSHDKLLERTLRAMDTLALHTGRDGQSARTDDNAMSGGLARLTRGRLRSWGERGAGRRAKPKRGEGGQLHVSIRYFISRTAGQQNKHRYFTAHRRTSRLFCFFDDDRPRVADGHRLA